MSLSSVIELLREAALKLDLLKEDGNQDVHGLDESEIASIIHQHYQDEKIKNRTNQEKRKLEQGDQDNKKFKPEIEVFDDRSALEKLPNEIYEMILYPLGAEDKNNLRRTCKGLNEKTIEMDPRYDYWCFHASKGTPPDFVLNTDKLFCVKVLGQNQYNHDKIGYLINRFAHRLLSLKIDARMNYPVLNYMRSMKPVGYPHLTTLDLQLEGDSDDFDINSLIQLGPQLVNLKIVGVFEGFDLSTVGEESKCFTKLKTLEFDCFGNVDFKKILTKCCNTLEYFKFDYTHSKAFEELEEELTALKCLDISVSYLSYKSIRNLLSKVGANLRTLKIQFSDFSLGEFDFSTLLEQDLFITTLDIAPDGNNVDKFLKKCPCIQSLTISHYCGKIKDVILKDLKKIAFHGCDGACISNVLKHLSKTLVSVTLTYNGLDYFNPSTINEFRKQEITELQRLDTLLITGYNHAPQSMDFIHKFFPENSQVTREVDGGDTVFRRVYNIT